MLIQHWDTASDKDISAMQSWSRNMQGHDFVPLVPIVPRVFGKRPRSVVSFMSLCEDTHSEHSIDVGVTSSQESSFKVKVTSCHAGHPISFWESHLQHGSTSSQTRMAPWSPHGLHKSSPSSREESPGVRQSTDFSGSVMASEVDRDDDVAGHCSASLVWTPMVWDPPFLAPGDLFCKR